MEQRAVGDTNLSTRKPRISTYPFVPVAAVGIANANGGTLKYSDELQQFRYSENYRYFSDAREQRRSWRHDDLRA